MKNTGLLSVLLGVLVSCSSGTKREAEAEDVNSLPVLPYHLDLEKLSEASHSPVLLSETGGKLSYIPLETNSDCLLKNIHELDFFNETLLISDFSNLYQFTNQGHFVKKIGKRGSGPADYRYVSSVLVNTDQTSFDMFTTGKINVYDEQAEFSKTVRLDDPDIHPFLGIRTSNDNSLLYLGSKFRVADDTTTIYSFAEIDPVGRVVRKIPNLSPVPSTYMGMIAASTPLYRYENAVRYMDYGNDTLFTITGEGLITPYAVCPLGSKKRELNTAGFNPQQMEALSSKLLIENIYEDEANLFIKLMWGWNTGSHYMAFNKQTQALYNIGKEGFQNDIDGGISFFPDMIKADGTKVMWMQAEDFIEQIQSLDYNKQKATFGEKFEKVWALASQMKPDDNPVLILLQNNADR